MYILDKGNVMIYYKNVLLNISNGLNSKRISTAPNPYADTDARMLSHACLSEGIVTASNGKEYYYFADRALNTDMIQYLLNCNGVLAYRRYSGYQLYYGDRRIVVRVPVEYVTSHPIANAFINKVINSKFKGEYINPIETMKFVDLVKKRMHQK